MEVFSLLRYWKGGGGGGGQAGVRMGCSHSSTASFATSDDDDDDDDGPFFDLDFADNDDGFHKLEGENEVIQEEEGIKSGPFPKSDSPIRTARQLRVLILRLKRSKSESMSTTASQTRNQNQHNNDSKLLRVNFKAEVPMISLLSRATSNSKVNTEQHAHGPCNEKPVNKRESVQKYLNMMKRKAEEAEAMTAAIKRLNLRKSESAVVPSNMASKRRDDSLLQQEDGIQSAILHCKRSFNASRDGE